MTVHWLPREVTSLMKIAFGRCPPSPKVTQHDRVGASQFQTPGEADRVRQLRCYGDLNRQEPNVIWNMTTPDEHR